MSHNRNKKVVHWADVEMETPLKILVKANEQPDKPINSSHETVSKYERKPANTTNNTGKKRETVGEGKPEKNGKKDTERKKKMQSGRADAVVVDLQTSKDEASTSKGSLFIVEESAKHLKQRKNQSSSINALKLTPGDDDGPGIQDKQAGQEETEDDVPNYIQCFMQFMYWTGSSPFNPGRDSAKPLTWGMFIVDICIKTIFWIGMALALLNSVKETKIEWLLFTYAPGITNFVDVGFEVVAVLAQIFVAHLLVLLHKKIKKMFCCLIGMYAGEKTYKKNNANKDQNKTDEIKKTKSRKNTLSYLLVVILGVVTILACCLKTGINESDWSLEKLALFHSKRISFGLFLWKPGDLNGNVTDALSQEYGTEPTVRNLMIGGLGILMSFCSNIRLEYAVDIIIVSGWCLKRHIRKLADKVGQIHFATCSNGNDLMELESSTGDWAQYRKLKEANEAMNVVYDALLKVLHAYNIMLSAYFMMHLLDNEVSSMEFLLLFYNIVKVSVAYLIAKQSHGYNAVFQKWMRDWAAHSDDPKFILKVLVILEEMKAEPLGLGTGDFIIGETFILKFVGMVTSLFMLQVDK